MSTSGGVATPLSSTRQKKRVSAALILFTMNPGLSRRTRTGVRPMVAHTFDTSSATAGSVFAPGITSTSFIVAGGLKKCIPTSLSGRGVASASSEIMMFEVLVATIASFGARSDASFRTDFFSSGDSGTASTTRSAWATASPMSPR